MAFRTFAGRVQRVRGAKESHRAVRLCKAQELLHVRLKELRPLGTTRGPAGRLRVLVVLQGQGRQGRHLLVDVGQLGLPAL